MSTYDHDDLLFQLFDIAKLDELLADIGSDLDRTAVEGILDTAAKVAAEVIAPAAHYIDENEPQFIDGKVILPEGLKEGVDAYIDTGLLATNLPEEYGGIDVPVSVSDAGDFIIKTADQSSFGYATLTAGAAGLIASYGTKAQKDVYLSKMVAGEWFGTMALSEPHAGSSLADITTRAEPMADGRYKISGNKMWISGGEHPLRENIVHLMLAKIPGGPVGVKGISLFIVPKVRPDGTFNNIELTGLNHKMGQRGLVNCALSLGDGGECIGELLGEPHHGLAYMFQMMNETRIHVGSGAVACAQAGFQASLAYAQERPQGRHPDQKDPSSKPVMLVEHADIRRLLLAQKATAEGGLALTFYCTGLVDTQSRSADKRQREQANLLLETLTPVMKAWPSEFGLEANKHAIQVLGGAGYTRDYPLERYYRDNRLNHIHEGTHGIQGIDLLGRKMTMLNGSARQLLMAKIAADIERAGSNSAAEEFVTALSAASARFNEVTNVLVGELREDPRKGLANATLYLDFTGHIVIAWMWLRIVMAAAQKSAREGESDFTRGKWQTARYFYSRELVRTEGWAKTLLANDASAFDMSVAGL